MDPTSPLGPRAQQVFVDALNGTQRVAFPWQTIGAFVRIATNHRASANPMTGDEAWGWVEQWLALDVTWIPPATESTARAYGDLARQMSITSNLVPDAMLADSVQIEIATHHIQGDNIVLICSNYLHLSNLRLIV